MQIYFIAGASGSGKSTILPELKKCLEIPSKSSYDLAAKTQGKWLV